MRGLTYIAVVTLLAGSLLPEAFTQAPSEVPAAFQPGTMTVEPRLANRCEPSADATVWTCRLRGGVRYADGARFDAGDVLASFVAQWDRSQPLRKGSDAPFAAWTALFGDTIGGE